MSPKVEPGASGSTALNVIDVMRADTVVDARTRMNAAIRVANMMILLRVRVPEGAGR
jgi:hypothetical protein